MRSGSLGMLAGLLVSGAVLGQEPMPLQVMPNSPAGRAYVQAASWQASPAPAPMMAYPQPSPAAMTYPAVYPAVWQFGASSNAGVIPAYQNDYLPNPGMVMGPPLSGPMNLAPLPLTPPKGPIVQTTAQAMSSAPPSACGCQPDACGSPTACCPAACCPPADCAPHEPYLVETNPWQPARCNHCYVMADYLLWFTKKQAIPDETGVGIPDLTLPVNGPRNGAQLTLGTWINPSRTVALEASGFWLENRNSSASLIQGANPAAVDLPFFLGIDSQTSSIQTSSQLWGAEIDARYKCWEHSGCVCRGYVDFLAGFRYLNLSESLTFANATLFSAAPVEFSGALINTTDFIGTHNNFYAPQVGVETGMEIGRFNVSVFSKIALGVNRESVTLAGQGVVTAPPFPLGNVVTPGGLLVQTPGHFNQEVFSYVPQAGINLGFKLFDWCQIGAGYSFLYFGNAVRPGDHVPPGSGSLFPLSILPIIGLPGTPPPAFSFNQSSFWAQGANFRITFIF
jgi:putative beta barrel porin BBP7